MIYSVRAGLVAAVLVICGLTVNAQRSGPVTQTALPWSVSGIDRAPDGTVYIVSDVDNLLYRFILNEAAIRNGNTPRLTTKAEPIALPITYTGGETKSGLESVRYVNDSTFLFTTEYDKPAAKSASALYLGKLRSAKMTLTEIVPDRCFSGTWTDNSGIEGMTLTYDRKGIWIVNERPFEEDLSTSNRRSVRLTHIDFNGRVIGQLAYDLQSRHEFQEEDAYLDNGVSEILVYDDHRILIVERAFGGVETCRTYCRVFLFDISHALRFSGCEPPVVVNLMEPDLKKLVFDAGQISPAVHVDNYEGITWGPLYDDGGRSIMLLSDDNGNWTKHACPQSTDLILFHE